MQIFIGLPKGNQITKWLYTTNSNVQFYISRKQYMKLIYMSWNKPEKRVDGQYGRVLVYLASLAGEEV